MNRSRLLIVLLLAVAGIGVVFAIDDATLQISQVDGAGFQVRDLVAQVHLTDDGWRVRARVGELRLRAGPHRLRDVAVDCPALELSALRIGCANASVSVELPALGPQRLRASVAYGRTDGSLRVDLREMRIGAGTGALRVALVDERWTVGADLRQAAIEPLFELARALGATVPEIAGTGAATLEVQAHGSNAAELTVADVQLRGELRELTVNNDSGTLASDKLQLGIDVHLERRTGEWRAQGQFSSTAGQAYLEPVFLDFGAHALAASAQGTWSDAGVLALERFVVNHTDVLDAQGSLQLAPGAAQPIRELQLDLRGLQFPGAYESYLQPYLVNTSFKSLTSSGSLRGTLALSEGVPRSAAVRFDALTLDDGARTFAIRGLCGELHWRNEGESAVQARASKLRFSSGTVLGLQLGSSELDFVTEARNVRLLETARIPVFDGAIALESFRIRNLATPQVAFLVDATIHPISVSQLCRAFGWPEFGGQIGGVVSKLRLRDGVLTLGTTLEARVFDGVVRLSDLRLEDSLGQWPRFYANIGLDDLDLNLVTQAFSFGRITGRLSGYVRDLRLFNWTPVGFDASLYTPPDDRSRHRISQRAVANIGNLGGGGASVTAALSSGFLKFFEEFNYDRLGLSCRLENEVCYMNGVAPAPNGGYYLVKGKGIPRIDVIAGARRVDWPRMVAQLQAATESSGPSVR